MRGVEGVCEVNCVWLVDSIKMRLWVKGYLKWGEGWEAVSKNIGFPLPQLLEKKGRWYKGRGRFQIEKCEKGEDFFKVAGGNKGVVVQLYCVPLSSDACNMGELEGLFWDLFLSCSFRDLVMISLSDLRINPFKASWRMRNGVLNSICSENQGTSHLVQATLRERSSVYVRLNFPPAY